MRKIKLATIPLIGILILIVLYFRKFFFNGLVPFPGNLLASFYTPWSNEKWPQFPAGVPRLDLLGVDTVRQDFPWKSLVTDALSRGVLPLWNPFSFSGHPQLAAFQAGTFYPLNIFFLIFSKIDAWTILTVLQPLLAFIFTYIFVRNLHIGKLGSFFAGVSFAFSPYLTAWLPWLMVPHTMLWLPLVLYCTDRVVDKGSLKDIFILTLSLSFCLFAGHPQITIYIFLTAIAYFIFRILGKIRIKEKVLLNTAAFLLGIILFLGITSIQWLPTAELYSQSLRESESSEFKIENTLLGFEKIATFLSPDFFGNPVTENYWGKGNYIESTFYPGITVLIFLGVAVIAVKKKTTKFFLFLIVTAFLLSFPTPFSKALILLKIPIFSSSVPTRILLLAVFSFSVLAGIGIDHWIKEKISLRKVIVVLITILVGYIILWSYSLFTHKIVSARNLILPTGIFIISSGFIFLGIFKSKLKTISYFFLICLFILDVFYLANKITYFSPRQFTFPSHPVIDFLQKEAGINRFYGEGSAKIDSNFGIVFNLQQAEGYDALYIRRYGELLTAANKGGKIINDISRTTADLPSEQSVYRDRIFSLLGVKYIIDKNDLYKKEWEPEYDKFPDDKYKLIWQKGKWKIYENKTAFPRLFLADMVVVEPDKQKIANYIFDPKFNLKKTVIIEKQPLLKLDSPDSTAEATLQNYGLNEIFIKTKADKNTILFLSDNFYPGWKAYIDGKETEIYLANYTFRAVFVLKGEHEVKFSFRSQTVKFGMLISLVSLAVFPILLVVGRKKGLKTTKDL